MANRSGLLDVRDDRADQARSPAGPVAISPSDRLLKKFFFVRVVLKSFLFSSRPP